MPRALTKANSTRHLSWIEISKSALDNNIRFLQSLSGSSETLLCAPIKGNAYGHGLAEIVALLGAHEVPYVAVHSLLEAQMARKAGWKRRILAVGYIMQCDTSSALRLKIEPTVYNEESIDSFGRAARANRTTAFIHLKIETGANRQGVSLRDLSKIVSHIAATHGVKLRGVSTHFANIEDTTDHSFAREQLEKFQGAVATIRKAGLAPEILHTASSAAHLVFPETRFDMVRPGIALYGHWPSRETLLSYHHATGAPTARGALATEHRHTLRPVLGWKARIAQIKTIAKGESVGYGLSYRASSRSTIAVVPVGYSDGYDRKLSGIAYVLVRGRRAPVRGRISMNNIVIDISGIRGVVLEEPVTLLGIDGPETISAEQLAQWAGTIQYEFLSRIAAHLPRIVV